MKKKLTKWVTPNDERTEWEKAEQGIRSLDGTF